MKKCNSYLFAFFMGLLLLPFLLAIEPLLADTQSLQTVDKKVEETILAEDWTKVADKLSSVDTQTPSPVLRLIKGHACLALNRNNESLCLFLSVSSEDELKEWEVWTQDFAKRNGKSAIACYFKGDAQARLKKRDFAITAFDEAIAYKPNHPLVLNARGVIYAAIDKLDNALLDFEEAVKANPSFADAYSNRGVRNIQKKAGAEGALKWFNSALEKSPDFALAFFGRGCAKLALGNLDESKKDIEESLEKKGCLDDIAKINIEEILNYMDVKEDAKFAGLSKDEVGTELDKRFNNFTQNPNKFTANAFEKALNKAESIDHNLYNQKLNEMRTYNEINPQFRDKAAPYIRSGLSTNAPGGWGEFGASTLNKFGVTFGKLGVDMGVGNHQQNVTKGNFKTWSDMDKAMFGGKGGVTWKGDTATWGGHKSSYGGVTSDMTSALMLDGNWPFVAYYGLSYTTHFK